MFESKIEKELRAKMAREEQMEEFNNQINELKSKREEYVHIAAEAELNNDQATYDTAANALIELNNVISSLTQTKANFDIINVSNSIAINMGNAIKALNQMATGPTQMPSIKKIQKANLKINRYMKNLKISQTAIARAMKSSNPANKARSAQELESVRPMIDAEVSRMIGDTAHGLNTNTSADTNMLNNKADEILQELNSEKNRII